MKKEIEIYQEQKNFRELLEFSCKKFKDNVAYVYKEDPSAKSPVYIEKTYKQVGEDVKALATALLKMGLSGKRIALISDNRYEWVIAYFATVCGGMVIAPMDKLLPEKEIESLVERSDVEAVVFQERYIETFKKLKKSDKNKLKTLICMDEIDDKDIVTLSSLLEQGRELRKNKNIDYDKVTVDNEEMSIMLFTSGTTDKSKIVMLSQKNICSNIWAYQRHFKMLPNDILLSFLPIHHTFESSITIFYGFYSGVKVAFCDGLRHIADNLVEYHVTIIVAVPLLLSTMYKKIEKGIEEQGKTKVIKRAVKISNILGKCHIDVRRKLFKQILDKFGGKLRIILYGAASLDKDSIIGFNNLGIDSIQGYGLTETSPVLVAESETKHCPGAAGYPLENVQIKIINPDEDGIGEVGAKGPNIMLGYYNDKEKTEESFDKDGWFKTGDYGYVDDEGFLHITGRKKDIIILKNGKNIYPDELEIMILKLSYVTECMVFVNPKLNDDILTAKIVYNKELIEKTFPEAKKDDYEKLVFKDVKELNGELPTYKHIKKVILTDEPMSKTTTQKIKRYEEIKKISK